MRQTDVLVIGAGPAGSAAGSMLARAGHQVLCLEAGTFPRFQIGESLLPRCNDLLEEAGLLPAVQARGYLPKPAALFTRGAERERFSFAEMFPGQRPAAMQVPRDDFDQTLATQARRFGADLRFSQRVEAVRFNQRCEADVVDLETQAKYTVQARFILDCSGYGRVLPKLLQLERPSVLAPRCAVFAHFEGDERPTGENEGDIWICIHPRGPWSWVIPFSNGRTSLGVVVEPAMLEAAGENDSARLKTLLEQDPNLRERFKNAVPVLKTQRLQGWSAAVTRFTGPGWALAGNASEFLDPIFSSGVTLALESAVRAAKLVGAQLKGEPVDWERDYTQVMARAVGVYRAFVESWYRGDLQRLVMAQNKANRTKRAITAVLGGYVLDERNPFVRDAVGTLSAASKLLELPED